MNMPKKVLHAITAVALLGACSSEDPGDAPTLANVTLDQATMEVGSQNVVTGTLDFSDPDGDVLEAGIEIVLPNGSRQALPPTPVASAEGLLEGTVALTLAIVPPMAGSYDLEIWLIDSGENDSNRLTVALTAE